LLRDGVDEHLHILCELFSNKFYHIQISDLPFPLLYICVCLYFSLFVYNFLHRSLSSLSHTPTPPPSSISLSLSTYTGGGTGSGNASTRSPCGKAGSNTVVDTYSPGEQVTVQYKRANNHGVTCNCVDFTLSYDAASANEPTNTHFSSGVTLLSNARMDVSTSNVQSATVTMPQTTGKAVLQFKWQPKRADGSNAGGAWYDCAYVEIVDNGPCASNNGGCHAEADCTTGANNAVQCKCAGEYFGNGITCSPLPAEVPVMVNVTASSVSQDTFTANVASALQIDVGRVLYDKSEAVSGSQTSTIHFAIGADRNTGTSGVEAAKRLRYMIGTGSTQVHTALGYTVESIEVSGVDASPLTFGSMPAEASSGGVNMGAVGGAIAVFTVVLFVAIAIVYRRDQARKSNSRAAAHLSHNVADSSSTSLPIVGTSATAATAAPVSSGLPPHWHEYVDDQGVTYYYNEQTGVSQWECP
jgi:WW domain/EGF domain